MKLCGSHESPGLLAILSPVWLPSHYWDQGHGANTDPGDFITWIAKVTGHKAK